MKKLLTVLMFALGLNFMAIAGGVGYLFKTGHLDREKIAELKKIVFPPTTEHSAEEPTTKPTEPTLPTMNLDALVAKVANKPAGEQVDFVRQTFDQQLAELDRKRRELLDLQTQIDMAKEQALIDRTKLEESQKELASKQQATAKQSDDKGFADSLQLYTTMPAKQVKTIFLSLSDDVVKRYIEAMPAKTATKIIREYKTPEETARIQMVLEQIRRSDKGGDAGANEKAPLPSGPSAVAQ